VNLQRVAPFRLARLKESPYVKQGTMVFEMRINSVFLGFFMDPNHLVFDTATRRLLEIHGPTLLKRKKGDEWIYADADIYYLYKERR